MALALGGFALLNVSAGILVPGFDANEWWIRLGFLPDGCARVTLGLAGGLLALYGLRPHAAAWRRRVTLAAAIFLLAATLLNAAHFFSLWTQARIAPGFPLPFSLLVAVSLLLVAWALQNPPHSAKRHASLWFAFCGSAGLAFFFPLAQMYCFGRTDYARPADAVVVFGARAYADGSPSDALADRVRTACDLYRDGLAKRLIFSGGPGDGEVHETEAMRRMARELGVPDAAIVCDRSGLNTRASVANTTRLCEDLGVRRVLAVSHSYHLPRVKLCYRRAGWEVHTVPARERYMLTKMPYLMLREVAAFWAYYALP